MRRVIGSPLAKVGVRPSDIGAGARVSALATTPDQSFEIAFDEAWAQRVRGGDTAAFESLFHACYGPLCAYAERLVGTPDDAEEVVSEVLLRIWKRRAQWTPHGKNIASYLYRAVRNRALDQLEHRAVRHRAHSAMTREGTAASMVASVFPPDAVAEAREFEEAAEAAVAELPLRTREAFVLQREQHLSYAEIADVMEISALTVKNHLVRAVKLLRERLRPWLD